MALSSEEQQAFADLTSGLTLDVRSRRRKLICLSLFVSVLGFSLLVMAFTRSFLLGCVGYVLMLGGALLGARTFPLLQEWTAPTLRERSERDAGLDR